MNYLADPGGHFPSDVHRRVLGHLTGPQEEQGWNVRALFVRMAADSTARFADLGELQGVLEELEADGHAERYGVEGEEGPVEVWRMSQAGFDLITGPIKNEPQPGQPVQGPATIGAVTALSAGATKLNLGGIGAADSPA